MKFKPYPKYKSLDVEWLSVVPEGWTAMPLKHLTHSVESGVSVNATDYPVTGIEIGVLKTSCVFGDVFRSEENKTIWEAERGRAACQVKKDTLVVSRMNTPALVGSCGHVVRDYPHLFLPDRLWMISLKKDIAAKVSKFFWYVLTSNDFKMLLPVIATGTSDSMKNIAQGDFFSLPVPMPPLNECQQIINFLDRETTKIDTLIAKQEKLIELLKEKRQAVISHAVTKGLDPTVPMKSSGIEWLGDVPEHWVLMTLIRITEERCDGPFGSGLKSAHYTNAGARVIRLKNIRDGYFNGDDAAFINLDYFENELLTHDVECDDVLIAGLGDDKNLVGRACVAPAGLGPALVKADCFRFRLDRTRANPFFVSLQLSSRARIDAGILATGSTRSRIPLSVMASRSMVLPPLKEQEDIVDFLNEALIKIDILLGKSQQAILLQKEHRAALISAAVTGKIDVRDFQILEVSEELAA